MILFATILMILIPTIVGALCSKGDKKKLIFFFYCLNHGVISAGKILTNKGSWIIWESFSGVYFITLVRYMIPLLVISIALAFVSRKMNENLLDRFLREYLSFFVCTLSLIVIVSGMTISNTDFAIACVAAGIISIVYMALSKNEANDNNQIKKESIKNIAAVLLFYVITMVVYVPGTLFAGNLGDLEISFGKLLAVLIASGAGALTILSLLIYLTVYGKRLKYLLRSLFILILEGYLQTNFFNGKMQAMDGTKQVWSGLTSSINFVLWITFFVAAFILLDKLKKNLGEKIVFWGSLYICAMQIVSLIVILFSTPMTNPERDGGFVSTKSMLELDEQNNVIVFVLDWFDEQVVERLETESPEGLQGLEDFTWYTNTTSKYGFTDMSIPYLLTGVDWQYKMTNEEYCEYAFNNSDFLQTVKDAGYSVGIYTVANDLGESARLLMDNYETTVNKSCYFGKTIEYMERCSRYNMAPFAIKKFFWYSTMSMNTLVANDNLYHTDIDTYFYKSLTGEKLKVSKENENNGAFRFYHLFGAHTPYEMDENCERVEDETDIIRQSRGTLKIINEYLQQLKKIGVYDNATIIITADHGQNWAVMNEEGAIQNNLEMTSNPVLWVKPSGTSGIDTIVKNKKQLTHEEVIPTIIDAMGLDSSSFGKTIYEIKDEDERERDFIFVSPTEYYRHYKIRGNARNSSDWELYEHD